MKAIAAICPLCQAVVPMPDDPLAHAGALREHGFTHTVDEWLEGTQALRDQLASDINLRLMPRCAMPRA